MSGVENACNNISFVVSCRVSCVVCRVSCVSSRWSIAALDQVANIRGRETLETEARSLRPPRVVFPAQNLGRIGNQEPRCALGRTGGLELRTRQAEARPGETRKVWCWWRRRGEVRLT